MAAIARKTAALRESAELPGLLPGTADGHRRNAVTVLTRSGRTSEIADGHQTWCTDVTESVASRTNYMARPKLTKAEKLVQEQMLALLEWAADRPKSWHPIDDTGRRARARTI